MSIECPQVVGEDLDSYPLVSVVMPVLDEAASIERAIVSVLTQSYPRERVELVVALGPSQDGTLDILTRLAARDRRIRVLSNPSGATPTGLNLGITASRGSLVARVDAHGWVDPEYLEAGVKAIERTGADAVGGVVTFVGTNTFGRSVALAEAARLGGGTAPFRSTRTETESDGLRWGLYKAEVFRRVGLFDESLARNQDDELCHRIRLYGGRMIVTPTMRLFQVVRSSPRTLWSQYAQFGRFRLATFSKHGPATPRQLAAPALVGALAVGVACELWSSGRVPLGRLGAAAYGAVITVVGGFAATKAREARSAPLVTFAVATMHLAYGWGFWSEAARRLLRATTVVSVLERRSHVLEEDRYTRASL